MSKRKHAQRGGERQSAPNRGESRPGGAAAGTEGIVEDAELLPPDRGEETATATPDQDAEEDDGIAATMRPPDDS